MTSLPTPPVSWEAVLDQIVNILGVPLSPLVGGGPSLDPRWQGICVDATWQAWIQIYQSFVAKGYGMSNVLANDMNRQMTLNNAIVIALERGSTFSQYSEKQLEMISQLKRIDEIGAVTIGGVPVAPAPGESPVGGVSFGIVQAVRDSIAR